MKTPTRETGYYWVKYDNQWIIALWITTPLEDYWLIPGVVHDNVKDEVFTLISNNPIKR